MFPLSYVYELDVQKRGQKNSHTTSQYIHWFLVGDTLSINMQVGVWQVMRHVNSSVNFTSHFTGVNI